MSFNYLPHSPQIELVDAERARVCYVYIKLTEEIPFRSCPRLCKDLDCYKMTLILYILSYFVGAVFSLQTNSKVVSDTNLQNKHPDLKRSSGMDQFGDDLFAISRGKKYIFIHGDKWVIQWRQANLDKVFIPWENFSLFAIVDKKNDV